MSDSIISFNEWLATAPGQYLLACEQAQLDAHVVDFFGYHALQLGMPPLQALRANRMPNQWLAVDTVGPVGDERAAIVTDFAALPFPASSLDLLVLPHVLERSADPHATLRESERVLVPDGKLVVCGFNPASLWGLRQRGTRWAHKDARALFLPEATELIGYWRLRDWLKLLGFEVELVRFGCYRPALQTPVWMERMAWMDTWGAKWWTIFGAVYFLVASKRVRGMRLLGTAWKPAKLAPGKIVPVGQRMEKQTEEKERG